MSVHKSNTPTDGVVKYIVPIQMTSAEARARAMVAANVSRRPHDGVGSIAATLLLVVFALGVAAGAVVTFIAMGGLS